jgi:hypothetical protein
MYVKVFSIFAKNVYYALSLESRMVLIGLGFFWQVSLAVSTGLNPVLDHPCSECPGVAPRDGEWSWQLLLAGPLAASVLGIFGLYIALCGTHAVEVN